MLFCFRIGWELRRIAHDKVLRALFGRGGGREGKANSTRRPPSPPHCSNRCQHYAHTLSSFPFSSWNLVARIAANEERKEGEQGHGCCIRQMWDRKKIGVFSRRKWRYSIFLLGIERLVRVHVCAGPVPSLYCLLKRRERADKSPALLSLSPFPLPFPLFIKGSFTAGHSQGQKEEEEEEEEGLANELRNSFPLHSQWVWMQGFSFPKRIQIPIVFVCTERTWEIRPCNSPCNNPNQEDSLSVLECCTPYEIP